MKTEKKHQILNRSFARRVGKALSALKQNLIDVELPKHLYNPERFNEKINNTNYNKVFLEIGFGMGEHFVNQVRSNQNALYIGVEVYINGVASALKEIKDCNNFMLWPDDLDLILPDIPKNSIDGIYVLFPDPWHKKRALKKRLFNQIRLNYFKEKLKSKGFIAFASDIEDYFHDVHKLIDADSDLIISNNDFSNPHPGYIQTKYHSKAIKEGRTAKFIQSCLKD